LNKFFLFDLLQLARFDKPIGIFLLLWPTLTALWVASNQLPDIKLIIIFTVGTILMRSAGCIANDLADQNIDKHVKRTKNRQLVLKNITNQTAFIFLLFLLVLSFLLVLQLNMYTIYLSILACISALIYPFFKRFFMIPQFFLGIAFSFGILLAFAAIKNTISLEGWLLFIANLFWVLGYDSHYALVDLEDDKKINIYSSAKTFGKFTPIFIIISFIFMYLIYFYFGYKNEYSKLFYFFMTLSSFANLYGFYAGLKNSTDGNFKAFKINNYVGLLIFLSFFTQIK
jgi:4-hydroxybenzoate polyprenyltransferase